MSQFYYKRYGKEAYGEKTINYYKKAYPNSIEVEDAIFVPCEDMDEFLVTSVAREDFESKGYDASGLTNEQMENIAGHLGEAYCEYGGFWENIDYWAEEYNLPRLSKEIDN